MSSDHIDPGLLVRHEPPFSDDQVRRTLGDENAWFRTGSVLYHEAEAMFERPSRSVGFRQLVIGKPAAGLVQPDSYTKLEQDIVPLMLYAMAVECWLKGLVIMGVRRESNLAKEELERRIGEVCEDEPSLEGRILIALKSFQQPEMQELHERAEESRRLEDKARSAIVSNRNTHNLVSLAADAGIEGLTDSDRDFLLFLSKAIILGRYPAPWKGSDVIPWDGVADASSRRDRVGTAILRRHDALRKVQPISLGLHAT